MAREDGIIWLLRVLEDSGTLSISDQTTAGVLKSSIGTAFALVDSHIENPDTLLSGGDLCDGGVYSVSDIWLFRVKVLNRYSLVKATCFPKWGWIHE